ncbi:Myosin-2-like protein [Drosera capensis]
MGKSSLEEMLDNLLRREEKPKDTPPALPSRPTSKARLPPARRSLPVNFRVGEVGVGVEEGKRKSGESEGEGEVGFSRSCSSNSFLNKRVRSDRLGESPYGCCPVVAVAVEESSGGGGAAGGASTPEATSAVEWEDNIGYFIKKLRVWCRLQNGQWELGTIQSTSGEESHVQLPAGTVFVVATADLLPANPGILEGVGDLIQLSYLNEPSVLHNLQHRYSHDMIYSKAGPVLIAINPFKEMHIYGNNYITAYRQKLADSPHVYAIADASYNEMVRDGVNPSIIISGDSGAGKTETARLAMQYLAALAAGAGGIELKVLQTNCILEAFGNAKTSKNDNSSRFVNKLHIKEASEYKFLNRSKSLAIDGINDAQEFDKLKEALDAIGIRKEYQESLFSLLALVLWLGNVSFEVTGNDNHVEVVVDEAVTVVSELMGCSISDLILALSTGIIQAGKDSIPKSLTLQQAMDARDALVKFIYASLFDWLVQKINQSLGEGKKQTGRSIAILDICGFESYEKNSFEQLCINYANERLQQHFNRHLLKLVQEDYEADGIDWTRVKFEDNLECLDLFEKKSLGLLSILDEESNLPKASCLTFAHKLKQHLEPHPRFRAGKDGSFSVNHFAGEVLYDTHGFLEKNRDPLPESIHLLSSCSSPLLKLFASSVLDRSQKLSVATTFKGQVYKLMQRLESTSPHFMHCIKPNEMRLPGNFDKDLVLRQLRCCGILKVVRIARSGYPKRITHQEFSQRYGFLLSDKNVSQDPLSISVAVLQQFNVLPEMYQVGYTKLYFRAGQIDALDITRKRVLQAIIGVQSCFRGYKARSQFHELKARASVLQAFVCGENGSMGHDEYAHPLKQKHRRHASKSLDEKQSAIIQLQSVIRGWLARRQFDDIQNCENLVDNFKVQQDSNISEEEVTPSLLSELERRVAKAEATISQKEEENAALKAQLQQCDKRWAEYEAKMRAMEEMWKKQVSLAAAKKSLATETTQGLPSRPDACPSPYYASDDNLSTGSRTPGRSTPLNLSNSASDAGTGREPNGGLNVVNHLVKEFEQRRQVFDHDAKAIVEIQSGPLNPSASADGELRRLKHRFEAWKKEYKVRLRDTKVIVHKLEHPDTDSRRRKWWGLLSTKRT